MIDPNTYGANFYNPANARATNQSLVFKEKNDVAGDQAAAADFARILNSIPAVSAAPPAAAVEDPGSNSFLGFLKDVLDVFNPLQHIPVVSAIYRHLTGDEIGPMARLAGDTLFGGPIGAALALADIAAQQTTGKDIGQTVIAALTDDAAGGGERTPGATDTIRVAENLPQQLNDQIAPAAGGPAPGASVIWSTPYGQKWHEPTDAGGGLAVPQVTPDKKAPAADEITWSGPAG